MVKDKIFTNKDKAKILDWLAGLQNSDGGFSSKVDDRSSISFSYYVFRSLLKLDSLDLINKNRLVNFIILNKYPDGGFSDRPGELTHPKYTSYAIFMLKELKAIDFNNIKKKWLSSLQKEDGGFDPQQIPSSQLGYTYYVLRCLSLLESLNYINLERVRKYIYKIKRNFIRNINNDCGSIINPEELKQILYIIDYIFY